MRGFALLAVFLLPACGGGGDDAREEAYAKAAAEAERIECAVGGAERFERNCTIERAAGEEGLTLTVRAPDGSFRRLQVTGDGRGVVAADGAEQAEVSVIADNRIEVAVAGDRYRLPATVKGAGQAR
ncbi:MAG: hypothetical protein ACK4K7_03435 [Allosphingosinicella sp.]|uniref:hypothetical protein n=1 Tax=Allosphingosinicella sp. TaxID=2823234 RepID=UPI00393A01BB